MDDLRVYVLFNSTSVKSGRWEGDNEKIRATESLLWLELSIKGNGR